MARTLAVLTSDRVSWSVCKRLKSQCYMYNDNDNNKSANDYNSGIYIRRDAVIISSFTEEFKWKMHGREAR